MWKRDQAARPGEPEGPGGLSTQPVPSSDLASRFVGKEAATIGQSVHVKGELSGSENLKIEGHVEGKIQLGEHALIVGPHGAIKAEVLAKIVIVEGQVDGNITASERVDIRDSGSMEGDITSPRVVIADGAVFRGTVDMQRSDKRTDKPAPPKAADAPSKAPAASAPPTPVPAPQAAKSGAS